MKTFEKAMIRFGAMASVLLLLTADVAQAQEAGSAGDPLNVINSVMIEKDGTTGKLDRTEIPRTAFGIDRTDPKPKEDAKQPDSEPSRLHPELARLLKEGDANERIPLLITLREDVAFPRFPDLAPGETRDSAAAAELRGRQEELVEGLRQARSKSQARLLETFRQQFRLEVKEQYWLINGFLAEAPLGTVEGLLKFDEVAYIQPQFGGEKPPADGNPNNDVADGRALIDSDPYFNLAGMTSGYIGLLDTGVRASHTLFNGPDHVDLLGDCVNGGAGCLNTAAPNYNADDDCWDHGTSTAGILTGNSNLGSAFRGVTAITVDSWKVYPNGCGGLDGNAVIRGFQTGLLWFDRVFVAEMQSGESENGAIAAAADNAFQAGAVVVAANGNNGPASGTVNSPAIAHKVIGAGAYDVQSLATPSYQSRGAATDGRYKPDVQTPTNTETASSASNTALQTFGGTSGATPYAAGAGALMRNWLKKFGTTDPGQVYSRLIVSGQDPWCCYDNTDGAGDLVMPTCGVAYWGKVSIGSTGATINIPIGIGSGRHDLEAALWWPEGVSEAHDDIDIYLIDPSGVERARGYSGVSVFERARESGSLTPGTWTVRIRGYSVASGAQSVYWTADVHGC